MKRLEPFKPFKPFKPFNLFNVAGVIAVALALSGCGGLAALGIAVDAATGIAGTVQRWEDRQAQKDQTDEIRKLRLEIKEFRERGVLPVFLCVTTSTASGQTALVCGPAPKADEKEEPKS